MLSSYGISVIGLDMRLPELRTPENARNVGRNGDKKLPRRGIEDMLGREVVLDVHRKTERPNRPQPTHVTKNGGIGKRHARHLHYEVDVG